MKPNAKIILDINGSKSHYAIYGKKKEKFLYEFYGIEKKDKPILCFCPDKMKDFEKIVKKLSLKVSGVTNQKNFLTNLGILKRAEIISKNLPFSKKTDIYFRVKRLVDKNLMGELFKVMLITKQNIKFQIGFKN